MLRYEVHIGGEPLFRLWLLEGASLSGMLSLSFGLIFRRQTGEKLFTRFARFFQIMHIGRTPMSSLSSFRLIWLTIGETGLFWYLFNLNFSRP